MTKCKVIALANQGYLYSKYVAGFFPRSYAMIWIAFTMISPILAFICWYAKGKSNLALILSAMILAILFNMTFVYGILYFDIRSILELQITFKRNASSATAERLFHF